MRDRYLLIRGASGVDQEVGGVWWAGGVALPEPGSTESRWARPPDGAPPVTCLVAQTQPHHRTQLCSAASPTH